MKRTFLVAVDVSRLLFIRQYAGFATTIRAMAFAGIATTQPSIHLLQRSLIRQINRKTTEGVYKCAVIVAADRLKVAAANADLKLKLG